MHWRTVAITSAVIVAAGLVGAGSASADAGWQPTVLPVPDEWRGAVAVGTDGHGEYSGAVHNWGGEDEKLAIWRGGAPILVDPPSGCTQVTPVDENANRVIVVRAEGCGDDGSERRAYTYSGGAYRELAPVDDSDVRPVAVNQRGDVVGQTGSPTNATVVWHPAAEPTVIPNTSIDKWPVDIDDDGTVLLATETGSYLWRDGAESQLAVPVGFDNAWGGAIRGGVVVGRATYADFPDDSSAYWWPTPSSPIFLPAGSYASDLNAGGLITGDLMTWQEGGTAGSLPIPAGYHSASAGAIGDDGSIVGSVSYFFEKEFVSPVVWRRG